MNNSTINKAFKNKVIDLVNFSESIIDYIRSENFDIFKTIADIKSDLIQWVKSGLLLREIKKEFSHFILRNKDKLGVKNWPNFCLKYLNQTHYYTDKIIDASQIVVVLIKKGFTILPNCEAQARHLVRFLPDYEYGKDYEIKEMEDELVTAWQASINLAEKENKPITQDLVLRVVDPNGYENQKSTIRLPKHIKDGLQQIALKNGNLTISEYLESLVISQEIEEQKSNISVEDQEQPIENKDQVWEDDLQELIKEHDQGTESQSKGFGKQPTKQQVQTKQSAKPKNAPPNFGLKVIDVVEDVFNAIAVNMCDLDSIEIINST